MSKALGKFLGVLIPYLIFSFMMATSGQNYASGSAIAVALKRLSFGTHEQYGIITLMILALITDSIAKRNL